jgi:transposase
MPPVDRNNPIRAKSSESSYSLMEFMREFPDDNACLEHLWRSRYAPDGENAYCPTCGHVRKFRRYKTKPVTQTWTCTSCTRKLSPTAGTIFHKSSTSLHLWYFAIFLITSTRCGISAKQLERELGVTYKTAWRMFTKIRNELMEQTDAPLSGEVEVDETFIKGRMRSKERRQRAESGVHPMNPHREGTSIVYGAVERKGRIRATTIPDSRARTLLGQTVEYVLPGSLAYTDEWKPYMRLNRLGYTHHRIRHRARIYVDGDVHTQTIDGFFGLVKNGIRGVHHGVSHKWLQGYLNEYAWRWNHRDDRDAPEAMFRLLLSRAAMIS